MRLRALGAALLLFAIAGCRSSGGGGGAASATATNAKPPQSGTPVNDGDVVPPAFVGRKNPLPDDAATIARGRALFLQNCKPCHGENADGKGPASVGLDPPPANFRDGVRLASHGDDYLFWRVTVGKRATAMPSFGAVLSDDDRWAILRYLRSIPGAQPKEGG